MLAGHGQVQGEDVPALCAWLWRLQRLPLFPLSWAAKSEVVSAKTEAGAAKTNTNKADGEVGGGVIISAAGQNRIRKMLYNEDLFTSERAEEMAGEISGLMGVVFNAVV